MGVRVAILWTYKVRKFIPPTPLPISNHGIVEDHKSFDHPFTFYSQKKREKKYIYKSSRSLVNNKKAIQV